MASLFPGNFSSQETSSSFPSSLRTPYPPSSLLHLLRRPKIPHSSPCKGNREFLRASSQNKPSLARFDEGGGGGGGGGREGWMGIHMDFHMAAHKADPSPTFLEAPRVPSFGGVPRKRSYLGKKPFVTFSSDGRLDSGGEVGPHEDGHVAAHDLSPLWMSNLLQLVDLLSISFPVWVAIACLSALARPQAFTWITGGWQMFGLIVTMLGMGMTLSVDDFGAAFSMPKEVLAGIILQYTVMPSAGAIIGRLFQLPSYYAAGLALVACCPGGTASNVVTYLARGHVALSVIMTSASTFLAVVMTPFLTAMLAGQYVAVDAVALLMSTLQVVLVPVMTGVAMAHYFPKIVKKVAPFAPLVAIIMVACLCASAIAQNSQAILASGGQIVLAVVSLHSIGFCLGFVLSKSLGFESSIARTISIEVGMQNSVLGVVLASQHFSNPLTAVPCAVSSVCHSILGSVLAAMWRTFPVANRDMTTQKNVPTG